MPVGAETLSNLIGAIYDCVLDPARWAGTLGNVCAALDFKTSGMTVVAMPGGRVLANIASGTEPDWVERSQHFGDDIAKIWGGEERFNAYPLEEPVVMSRDVPRHEYEATRYYREWMEPQGLSDGMALILARDSRTYSAIALGRHGSAGVIGDREIMAARLLLPHFQRAVAIGRVVDLKTLAAASFAAALDAQAAAIMLVDIDLRIVHANEAAESLLSSGDPIASREGRLALRSPPAEMALAVAVRQGAEQEAETGRRGFGIPAPRLTGDPSVLHVLPLRYGRFRPGLAPAAAAAIFVAPASAPDTALSEAVPVLFDLTAAEARVLARLAAGDNLAEAASALGIGRGTAKTHLHRIFAKTGTRSQADLVRLAGALASPG